MRGNKRERMEEKRMAARQRESERTTENKTATDWTRTHLKGFQVMSRIFPWSSEGGERAPVLFQLFCVS